MNPIQFAIYNGFYHMYDVPVPAATSSHVNHMAKLGIIVFIGDVTYPIGTLNKAGQFLLPFTQTKKERISIASFLEGQTCFSEEDRLSIRECLRKAFESKRDNVEQLVGDWAIVNMDYEGDIMSAKIQWVIDLLLR